MSIKNINFFNIFFNLGIAFFLVYIYNITNMKTYFIFLDIDGVLWDNRQYEHPRFKSQELNSESVEALNFLVKQIAHNGYAPQIVVVSRQRTNWQACQNLLYSHNVTKSVPMIKLPIPNSDCKFSRGERINIFLHDFAHGKDVTTGVRKYTAFDHFGKNYAKKFKDFVMLEDDFLNLKNIPEENIIKTNIDYDCLDIHKVINFLNNKNFKIVPDKQQ